MKPRKMSNNGIIILLMVLSLCLLSLIKSRISPTPLGTPSKPILSTKAKVNGSFQPEIQKVNASICYESSSRSTTCDLVGDIRLSGSTATILVNISSIGTERQWKTKPYARKDGTVESHVKEWTLISTNVDLPTCTVKHTVPAVVFSAGGYTGNMFHDFTDVIVPLFVTSHGFHKKVQFVVSDGKSWWIDRFLPVLKQLSMFDIVNAAEDGGQVRCFRRVIVGPTFHKELGVDQSKAPAGTSMAAFRRLLMKGLDLERKTVIIGTARPRLLIISRRRSRSFLNERSLAEMARSVGFEVLVREPEMSLDLSKFARLVNSVDVLVGVHGAGLTNMVFLPKGAVVIQVIPFGGLEWVARDTFKYPSKDMGLNYLDYVIKEEESSLIEQYPIDHPVFKDPFSYHKKGWNVMKSLYLDKQDVRVHLGRFREVLREALEVLKRRDEN